MKIPIDSWIERYPSVAFFALAFAISWAGALAVAAPRLWRGEALSTFTGLIMFPVMLLGPFAAGLLLTWKTLGKFGLRNLARRMRPWGFAARWYTVLLIAPTLIFSVLLVMQRYVSPAFAPNHFWLGLSFGIAAGLLEEIGWTGYAFPALIRSHNPLASAVMLGLLWGTWHLPVINYLGVATPHGAYWLHYFVAFTIAMTAMRVLISWAYANTGSVFLSQLMHIASTGSLVVFSPPRVTASQESLWYLVYGGTLWLAVAVVLAVYGTSFRARWR